MNGRGQRRRRTVDPAAGRDGRRGLLARLAAAGRDGRRGLLARLAAAVAVVALLAAPGTATGAPGGSGASAGTGPTLDVAVLTPPGAARATTWQLRREADGSVQVTGPVAGVESPRRLVFRPPESSEYVGGTLVQVVGGQPDVLLVRSDGALLRSRGNLPGRSALPRVVGSVGAPAVAAVSRSADPGDPGDPGRPGPAAADPGPGQRHTILVVLRADGRVLTFRAGPASGDPSVGATQQPEPPGSGGPLRVPVASAALVDLDFSCAAIRVSLVPGAPATGLAAALLGCPTRRALPGDDVLSLGRLSVAIAQPGQPMAAVSVFTTADYASEDSNGLWRLVTEWPRDLGCPLPQPVALGSFDLRTVADATHLSCAVAAHSRRRAGSTVEYVQPGGGSVVRRAHEASSTRAAVRRTSTGARPTATTASGSQGPAPALDRAPAAVADPASAHTITAGDAEPMLEGRRTSAVFRISLDRPADRLISVRFRTRADSAQASDDYRSRRGTLVWRPGEQVRTVRVQVRPDVIREPTELFSLRLSRPSAGARIGDDAGSAWILDDDRRRVANPG